MAAKAASETEPLVQKKIEHLSAYHRAASIAVTLFVVVGIMLTLPGSPGLAMRYYVGNRFFPPLHPSCPLPSGARWCRARPGFDVACLEHDIVCNNICSWGYWEYASMKSLGFPEQLDGVVVDVGANVGWYSLLFAHAGYDVHAFEAMPSNVQLLKASTCANPMTGKVQVHSVALAADAAGSCRVFSSKRNVGNGTLCCPGHECYPEHNPFYEMRADKVATTTLDAELSALSKPIAFMKLDVEGYECQVMKGGLNILASHPPKYMMSEVWNDEVGCGAASYLSLLRGLGPGYSVRLRKEDQGFLANNSDTADPKDFDHIKDVFAVRHEPRVGEA